MTTFYLDFEGGNDANAGTSFALRWKTITSGATAARIAAGDTIRIMASPDETSLGQNVTWTAGSPTLTLTTAVTQTVSNCETAWTASANVTATAAATRRRQGTNAASLVVATGFTTGIIAYSATGTLDLSGYQQASFWIYTTAAVAANALVLDFCSDTVGAVPVDSFTIPFATPAGAWWPVTINKGSALGASIQSVALRAATDPGGVTIWLDNIIACKAPSAADSLTHNSMISKNIGTEPWWFPVMNIDGTTVTLNGSWSAVNQGAGWDYPGTTATTTTYKRESIFADVGTSTVNDSGTLNNPITFSGGWNRTDMSTQTGETWVRGKGNTTLIGLDISSQDSIVTEKLHWHYWVTGVDISDAGGNYRVALIDLKTCGCDTGVVLTSVMGGGIQNYASATCFTSVLTSNAGTYTGPRTVKGGYLAKAGTVGAAAIINGGSPFTLEVTELHGGSQSIDATTMKEELRLKNINFRGAGAFNISGGKTSRIKSFNCNYPGGISGDMEFMSVKHNQIADNHVYYIPLSKGTVVSATDQRHTASGISWKFLLDVANSNADFPALFPLGKVAVAASALVTVKLWCRRDNTGLTLGLHVPGGYIGGVASDIFTPMTAAINTWEEVTVTFTPTEAGVVELFAYAYGGTTFAGWIDDLSITQA